MPAQNKQLVEQVIQTVLSSPKYQHISPELVARIGSQEMLKRANLKEAVKAAKNKLHQVGGAYLDKPPDYAKWTAELHAIPKGDTAALQAACRRMMGWHASTRERLPALDGFYAEIFSHMPPVKSILDLACGFNPLALPWMSLAPDTQYFAWDIYADMIAFINDFFHLYGQAGQAEVRDVLALEATPRVDLALVLKTIPCLEQVDKSAGSRLLAAIQARYLLVSFPVRSLGGRSKGMPEHYAASFERLAAGQAWQVQRIEFAGELVFLVDKGDER